MKPLLIGRLEPPGDVDIEGLLAKHLLCLARKTVRSLGDVEMETVPLDFKCFASLKEFAVCNGLKPRLSLSYNPPGFLSCVGSIPWHTDDVVKYLLSWVIHLGEFGNTTSWTPSQICSRSGNLDIQEGDVFLFDASREHAWISNEEVVMLQLPVSRTKLFMNSFRSGKGK